ncbi:MAG: PQQ-binding-like beta-propeller repeat protein [Mycobacteriales bacterium]
MRTRAVVVSAVAVVLLGALAAVAVPVVRSSDVVTTEIRVAPDDPVPPATAPLPADVRPLWTVPSTGAAGPVEGPTAVATGTDRVAGLDPATGRERWSYRRGNARLCSSALRDGVVIALFAKSHGCRDLVGLDAATGGRRWTRTVEFTTEAVLSSGPSVAVATGGSKMIAVDPGGGLNRWTYTAAGCRLDLPVAGRVAVATIAHCAGEDRLVVHDPYVDRQPWVRAQPAGSDPRVVAAGDEVAVLSRSDGTPTLTGYLPRETEGNKQAATRAGAVRDARLAYRTGGPLATVTGVQVLVLWTGERLVAVGRRTRQVLWTAAAAGPPALVDGQLLVVDAGGFTARPVLQGTPATRVLVTGDAVPAPAALSRIGRLVVVAGAGRLSAYG